MGIHDIFGLTTPRNNVAPPLMSRGGDLNLHMKMTSDEKTFMSAHRCGTDTTLFTTPDAYKLTLTTDDGQTKTLYFCRWTSDAAPRLDQAEYEDDVFIVPHHFQWSDITITGNQKSHSIHVSARATSDTSERSLEIETSVPAPSPQNTPPPGKPSEPHA